MKLSEVAHRLHARLVAGEGQSQPVDGEVDITAVAGIEQAGPGEITFIANPKYASAISTTRATAVIVAEDFPPAQITTLRTSNPRLAFARSVELFYQRPVYSPGLHPTAVIDPSAKLGRGASIGPCVIIDADVEIGDGCVLLPHVVIYRGARIGHRFFAHSHAVVREYCQIGDDVTLQNGAVIGADGFGFSKDDEGGWQKIVQSGIVALEDRVEVQALACVDRASIGETRVKRGAKIDNLVQVGHGSVVGENSMLCAQAGLAGSTTLGKDVILAGQVGVAGHCHIGDGVVATAQTGIPHDVAAGQMVSGYPAIENRRWLRCVAMFNKLPELGKAVRKSREPANP